MKKTARPTISTSQAVSKKIMIKEIFCDMDGTLLNAKGEISEKNIKSIKKLKIPLTLVSARAPIEMDFAIQALHLKNPQIAFNGGLIFQGDEVLSASAINYLISNMLLKYITQNFPEISLSYYTKEHWYTAKVDKGIRYESRLTKQKPWLTSIENFTNYFHQVFKIMLIIFDEKMLQIVKNKLESLKIASISIQQSGKIYLEITSGRAQKSFAIQFLLNENHLVKSEIAVLGDGKNDLPMFELSDCSIAMENAQPEIKKVARFVSKSNEKDGVSYALKHFLA